MSDMRRLLEEKGDDAATALLRSARVDRAPAGSKARALAALGIENSRTAKAREIPALEVGVARHVMPPRRQAPRQVRAAMARSKRPAEATPHLLFQSVLGPTGRPIGVFQKGRLGVALVAGAQVVLLGIVLLSRPMQRPEMSKGSVDEPRQYTELQLGAGQPAPPPAPAPNAEKKEHERVRGVTPIAVPRPGPNVVLEPGQVAVVDEPSSAEQARAPEDVPGAVAAGGAEAPQAERAAKQSAPAEILRSIHREPAGLTQPKRIGGRDPSYTREALQARVEGTALVQCLVTAEGATKNCRILESLPHMDGELLAAARTWRFSPATRGGRPVSIEYVFKVNLVLPK